MDYTIIAFSGGLLSYWFYENVKEKKRRKREKVKILEQNEKLKVNPPVTITIKKDG